MVDMEELDELHHSQYYSCSPAMCTHQCFDLSVSQTQI